MAEKTAYSALCVAISHRNKCISQFMLVVKIHIFCSIEVRLILIMFHNHIVLVLVGNVDLSMLECRVVGNIHVHIFYETC